MASLSTTATIESRALISRLRHRQFGMLVTTSYLGNQPYKEIVEDDHPIVVCAGGDLAQLMIEKKGLSSGPQMRAWLEVAYPIAKASEN